ncbi:MAG: glycoside hydrolase family 125 protein, partial [Verrucomicrobia bacterium]|nr:glycoside hydrolase family 125 protein [Verrucomicrobiota bacterium]
TIFPLLVSSNFFAVVSLRQAAEMLGRIHHDSESAAQSSALADEVEHALREYAVVQLPGAGPGYAYEVDAYGGRNCMDDANVPSLLALPYLGAVKRDDPLYRNTRRWALSLRNPYYFKGAAAEGLGGPHTGLNMIWPLGLIVQALTSADDEEIRRCLDLLQKTQAGTGFIHESFYKDDSKKYTRSWFAWANTIFGELILTTFEKQPQLLN